MPATPLDVGSRSDGERSASEGASVTGDRLAGSVREDLAGTRSATSISTRIRDWSRHWKGVVTTTRELAGPLTHMIRSMPSGEASMVTRMAITSARDKTAHAMPLASNTVTVTPVQPHSETDAMYFATRSRPTTGF